MGNNATFSAQQADKAYISDPPQPALEGNIPRIKARGSQVVAGVRYFAPVLPQDAKLQVLVIGISPSAEEASGLHVTSYGEEIKQTPRLLKGPLGTLLPDSLGRHRSLSASRMGYTVLCPWLLPGSRRNKPTKAEIAWAAPALHEMIQETKPEIIVACGKVVFDQLAPFNISYDDARGCWFSYNDIPLYLADPLSFIITKPWTLEQLITDFREVNRILEFREGITESPMANLDLRVIDTYEQLDALVDEWESGNHTEFSVDCEWRGTTFLDGTLRSIQFSWTPTTAAYLRFFNEHGELFLGKEGESTDYREVGKRLNRWLDRKDVTYIAHHASADSPWMEQILGIEVAGKFSFDTEFALQTADEYAPLGLDNVAMRFTRFGRYDQDLLMWKRAAKPDPDDGYGTVPDHILIPYAQLDVLVVKQAKPSIERILDRQDLLGYYKYRLNPFVTDVFHDWVVGGLPVNIERFQLVREFMNWAYKVLLDDFRQRLAQQADEILAGQCGNDAELVARARELRDVGNGTAVMELLAGEGHTPDQKLLNHWMGVTSMNIRSGDQMRLWLFDVMKFTPVKTTKGGDGGLPQMTWDRVMELPENVRKLAVPATDKETLEILSSQDTSGLLLACLAVSNVGNQCKGFLKSGTAGPDGEVIKENGLAKFLCSDNRLHPNYSLTETSRPRSWKPNCLNLSSYHNKGVETGLIRIIDHIGVPEKFKALFGDPEKLANTPAKELVKKQMPSIRSIVQADAGCCFVESDYQTAEVRALAFRSGDTALLKLILGKDTSFGICGEHKVRLRYAENSPIAEEFRDPRFLMAICVEGKEPYPITYEELAKNEDGSLKHPKFDMHWAVAEESQKKPREMLSESRDRGAGKVTRFSGSYGASGATIDRRIEAVTGIKPEPGTGQAMLEALALSQPVATQFLDDVAEAPKRGEVLVAASGRKRRFPIHSSELQGMPWRVKKAYLRSMGNEARNFYMQESVAATLSQACMGLRSFFRKHGMKARTIIGLYDAILTHCPLEERMVVAKAHDVFMTDTVCWNYHGRWMNYPIDTDLLTRWSWKKDADEKKKLHDPLFHPMSKEREDYLMGELEKVKRQFYDLQPGILDRLNVV